MIKKFKISLKESLLYYQKFGFLQSIKSNETPFVLQISKYLFFGITVTFVHALIVYGLGYFLNPAIGDSIPKELKLNRTIWNNVYAFLVSNSIAFWLNSKFLFKPGRHDKIKEILLFFQHTLTNTTKMARILLSNIHLSLKKQEITVLNIS